MIAIKYPRELSQKLLTLLIYYTLKNGRGVIIAVRSDLDIESTYYVVSINKDC